MLIQDLRTAISYRKQTALATAVANAAQYWSFSQRNRQIPFVRPNTETNQGEIGVGRFPNEVRKISRIFEHSLEMIASPEMAALLFSAALGVRGKAAHGLSGFLYTITPFATTQTNLDVLTFWIGLGAGTADEILDTQAIGVAVEEVGLEVTSGVNADNAKLTAQLVGTGRVLANSGFVAPSAASFDFLNAGGMSTLTICGINYLTNFRHTSVNFSYKNNTKTNSNYRAGGGRQDGFAVMARMLAGSPTVTLRARVEAAPGSSEETLLINQTIGALDMKIDGSVLGAGPEIGYIRVQAPSVRVAAITPVEDDDIVGFDVEYAIGKMEPQEPVTVTVACDTDDIWSAAA